MPLLTDLSLAMRTDPLALIRGATEIVMVIYGPAVTFAFPDIKVRSIQEIGAAPEPSFQQWTEEHLISVNSTHYEKR